MIQISEGPERRYGKALFELAKEQKQEKKLREELAVLREALTSSVDVDNLLRNPLITNHQKENVLKTLLEKSGASDLLVRFVRLVAQKGRAELLANMTGWFMFYDMADRGVVEVKALSATALTDKQKDEISKFVLTQAPEAKEVQILDEISPTLIGGVKIQIGSAEFDASIKGKLNRMSGALKS